MRPVRKQRISSFLRTEIARVIQHELRDPRVGFVSITGVEPTEDLKEAKVSVSILGDEATQRTTLRGLQAARGFIQSHLAKVISFRETPMLQFVLDDTIRKQMSMDAKIQEVRALDDPTVKSTRGESGTEDPDIGSAGEGSSDADRLVETDPYRSEGAFEDELNDAQE